MKVTDTGYTMEILDGVAAIIRPGDKVIVRLNRDRVGDAEAERLFRGLEKMLGKGNALVLMLPEESSVEHSVLLPKQP